MDDRDYILDIEGLQPTGQTTPEGSGRRSDHNGRRPWIAIHFRCCHAYARLYRNPAGNAYEGRCPKCGAATRATIGPGGTDQRFFTAE